MASSDIQLNIDGCKSYADTAFAIYVDRLRGMTKEEQRLEVFDYFNKEIPLELQEQNREYLSLTLVMIDRIYNMDVKKKRDIFQEYFQECVEKQGLVYKTPVKI